LVTGGASGLGKATVERLVQQGSRVVLCDLQSSKGHEVAKTIGEDKVIFAPVNVRSTITTDVVDVLISFFSH
jgi:3-hydroxyacyl-CoA dehydrogenase/3-hydroxy-2-methylbutyryl-CoA dehydrogenase